MKKGEAEAGGGVSKDCVGTGFQFWRVLSCTRSLVSLSSPGDETLILTRFRHDPSAAQSSGSEICRRLALLLVDVEWNDRWFWKLAVADVVGEG